MISSREKRDLYRYSIQKRKSNRFKNSIEKVEPESFSRRSFISATTNRLTQDFNSAQNSINNDIYSSLEKTRGRSREAFINNDHYRRYIKRYITGVIGAQGVTLASKIKDEQGKVDKNDVATVEKGWKLFSKKENFSCSKAISFHMFSMICVGQKKRDGEAYIRLLRGFDNYFSFAIQIIEPHYLDEGYNLDLANGNCVRNGIEFNKWGERINYHFSEMLKTENAFSNSQKYGKKVIIPADEIIHYFKPDEFSQNRGYPEAQQTMLDIHNLKGTNSAEVIKKRIISNNMGFFMPPEGQDYQGDSLNADGTGDFEVEAGMMKKLPAGTTVAQFNPDDSGDGNSVFNKLMLRQMAVGTGLAYHSLTNDYDGLNKEALRDITINERDEFILEQAIFIEQVATPIFLEWLKFAILTGKLDLPFAKIEKFRSHEFLPRAFAPINDLEEAQANDISINNATKSRTQINRARNVDQDEIFAELSQEEIDSKDALVPLRNQGGTASMNLLNDMPQSKPTQKPEVKK